MKKEHAAPPSFTFKRTKPEGSIQVLNEGSYVMAEYSERTGVVVTAQREKIEKWLGDHYPAQATVKA
jgi:hypothetical protein